MTATIGLFDAKTVEEVEALLRQRMSCADAETMLRALRRSANIWIGRVDGAVACIWGLIPPCLISNQAYLWLYTTELVESHTFVFVRASQRMVEEMLKEYPTLVGHVHVDNPRAAKWLRWLGASFQEPDGKRIPFQIRA